MLTRFLTAGAAMFALVSAAAAADLPSKAAEPDYAPPPPIPVFSWTGSYLGIQAGYGFGRDAAGLRTRLGGTGFGADLNGIVGGAHIGFNYALPAAIGGTTLVAGLEGDVDGADDQRTVSPFGGVLGGDTAAIRSDIKGSVRGRIGVAVNRVLFYATGGAAFAEFNTLYNATPTFGAGAFNSFDRAQTGYTVGGGVEYAFMNYMSVRAEYRYTSYGSFSDQLGSAAPGLGASVSHKETDSRIQAGFSYKFDSILPTPAVAHY